MKVKENILDILGIGLFLFSIYGFYFLEVGFWESTGFGVFGVSLFLLKNSIIRKFITKLFNAAIEKYFKK